MVTITGVGAGGITPISSVQPAGFLASSSLIHRAPTFTTAYRPETESTPAILRADSAGSRPSATVATSASAPFAPLNRPGRLNRKS